MQQPICLAKALVDCLPNPYDKEALRFKVGFPRELLHFVKVVKRRELKGIDVFSQSIDWELNIYIVHCTLPLATF